MRDVASEDMESKVVIEELYISNVTPILRFGKRKRLFHAMEPLNRLQKALLLVSLHYIIIKWKI